MKGLFSQLSFPPWRKPNVEIGVVSILEWGGPQWNVQRYKDGKLCRHQPIAKTARWKPLDVAIETSGPAQASVTSALGQAKTCILLSDAQVRPENLWPADVFACLMRRAAGIFAVKGGWLYVIEPNVAGFSFAVLDRKGQPLQARAIRFRSRHLVSNIYVIDNLTIGNLWTGNRIDTGWSITRRDPRRDDLTALLERAREIFFDKINPQLDHAIVSGPNDPILEPAAPVFEKGSPAQLEDLLRDISILSFDDEVIYRIVYSSAVPYRAFLYNRDGRHSLSSRVDFIERYLLNVMRPTGESTHLYVTGDDNSRLKSSYRIVPWGESIVINLAQPTGHEKISAYKRLMSWLADEVGLDAAQAAQKLLWLSGGKK